MKFTSDAPRKKEVNKIVSNLPGVREAVAETTREVGARASANLASRRDDGVHSIDVDTSGVDGFVTLSGRGALSLELGHHHKTSKKWVEGTRILRDALGGA